MPLDENLAGDPAALPAQRPQGHECRTACLVTALTIEDFLDAELTTSTQSRPPQLGVMTLAAILRAAGFRLEIVNLDDLFIKFLHSRGTKLDLSKQTGERAAGTGGTRSCEAEPDAQFLPFVLSSFANLSWDVVGLSSICSSYPLTLRLAGELKKLHPEAPLILGGPQASVVDVATMQAFPCVDFVVRGEGDRTLPALLRLLVRGDREGWEQLAGVTFRRDGEIVRNPNAPVVGDLDEIPIPAFDLDSDVTRRPTGIHLEIGRGCPFACSFCSTNDFFRRNFRLKSPARMIEQMEAVHQRYGVGYFSLVHDMYTVDRRRVVAFCDALRGSGHQFRWGCSARTDCVDEGLLRLMAEAGCTGIFFGIETGSQRLQHVINKKLDLAEAWASIEQADRYGITMSVALIMGFPEEEREDLRDTVHFFIEALRFDAAEPQISLLAPLAATPVYEQYRDRLVFDNIFSDMSHQGWQHDPADVELIKAYPEIFPNFYAVPTQCVERTYLKELRDFLNYVPVRFRWLPVALVQDSGDFLNVFERWRGWLAERRVQRPEDELGPVLYYAHAQFYHDFLEFVRTCYLPEMARAPLPIEALVRTEDIGQGALGWAPAAVENVEFLASDCMPYPMGVRVLDIPVEYDALIGCLRRREDLSRLPQRNSTIVFVPTESGHLESKRTNVVRMQIRQLSPMAAKLLSLCDGRNTIGDITQAFCETTASVEGVPAYTACLFGLMQLRQDGLINISKSAITIEPWPDPDEDEGLPESWPIPAPHQGNTQQPWPVA